MMLYDSGRFINFIVSKYSKKQFLSYIYGDRVKPLFITQWI